MNGIYACLCLYIPFFISPSYSFSFFFPLLLFPFNSLPLFIVPMFIGYVLFTLPHHQGRYSHREKHLLTYVDGGKEEKMDIKKICIQSFFHFFNFVSPRQSSCVHCSFARRNRGSIPTQIAGLLGSALVAERLPNACGKKEAWGGKKKAWEGK